MARNTGLRTRPTTDAGRAESASSARQPFLKTLLSTAGVTFRSSLDPSRGESNKLVFTHSESVRPNALPKSLVRRCASHAVWLPLFIVLLLYFFDKPLWQQRCSIPCLVDTWPRVLGLLCRENPSIYLPSALGGGREHPWHHCPFSLLLAPHPCWIDRTQ